MTKKLIRFLNSILKRFNVSIVKHSTILKYHKYDRIHKYLENIPDNKVSKVFEIFEISQSQIYQDIFVLNELDYKRNGFFVEFGATNGKTMSNTYILEKEFGWNGILAEPAICWHGELKSNRNCYIDTHCVWNKSNEVLKFNQVSVAEYSTIDGFKYTDHSKHNLNNSYEVETISLEDLLLKYNAPQVIDYLSIDTEGSEYQILKNFNFSKYDIRIITCEHNLSPMRDKIYSLLIKQGYARKYTDFSRWDDWYVKLI